MTPAELSSPCVTWPQRLRPTMPARRPLTWERPGPGVWCPALSTRSASLAELTTMGTCGPSARFVEARAVVERDCSFVPSMREGLSAGECLATRRVTDAVDPMRHAARSDQWCPPRDLDTPARSLPARRAHVSSSKKKRRRHAGAMTTTETSPMRFVLSAPWPLLHPRWRFRRRVLLF